MRLRTFRSILTAFVMLSVLTVGWAEAQRQDSLRPSQNPYAHDPCGDPRNESSFWFSVSGKTLTVIDGDTIVISHKRKRVVVQLVGIEAPTLNQPYGGDAYALLEQLVKDKTVDVWISPSDSIDKRPHRKELLGVVYLPDQNMLDVNLELVTAGLARHNTPPPYKMSAYTACRYFKAEEQARTAKRGLWNTAL